MAQAHLPNEANTHGSDAPAPAQISSNDALALLRLLSPQSAERTYSGANLLNVPNGGQLYVTPHLFI